MVKIRKHPKFENVFLSGSKEFLRIYTINLDRGKTVYGEKLVEEGNVQYREWNPYRSKLCSCMVNKAHHTYLGKSTRLLYLGASSGTTVSHCSDIALNGVIYAVEFSQRSLRELVQNCADRPNVVPILGDANHPYEYSNFITGPVDLIIQDVAQPNQAEILIKNAKRFLQPGKGKFIYEVKARSIDTTGEPMEIFEKEIEKLSEAGLKVTDNISIHKYQIDHTVLIGRYVGK